MLLHPADAAKRPGGKKGKHPQTIAIKELRVGDRIMKVPIGGRRKFRNSMKPCRNSPTSMGDISALSVALRFG